MALKIFDDETGIVVNEIRPGDRILRKESVDFLKGVGTERINMGETFLKLYTSILKDLKDERLTGAEWQVLITCLCHLAYTSGGIIYSNNGHFLTPVDIEKESGLPKRTVMLCIEKLTDRKILHKGRTGREFQLYANPYIFMKGTEMSKITIDMFKNTKWAKLHKLESNF